MSKKSSPDVAFFLVGGVDMLGTLTQFSAEHEALLERTDVLGDAWETHGFIGRRKSEITQEGFYDDAAQSAHAALSTGPGVSKVMCYGLEGTATGAEVVGYEGAMQVNYTKLMDLGGLHKAKASYHGNGQVDAAKLLRTWKVAAATGASTGTPLDGLACSTGGAGYVQYNSLAGEANLRILHSSDNITYAALFTFPKSTASAEGLRMITTAMIERYVATDYTTATATGSVGNLTWMAALARGIVSS